MPKFLAWVTLAALSSVPAPSVAADTRPTIAVADFMYRDSSGEVRDQAAVHAARLRDFDDGLRQDLQASGTYRVVALPCGDHSDCIGNDIDPAELGAKAKAAGASLLAVGGIHKMSTLVQFARLDVIDLSSNKVVFNRLYTFRGDTDEAWQKAQQFIAREIEQRGSPQGFTPAH
jgi:hypothetical protein